MIRSLVAAIAFAIVPATALAQTGAPAAPTPAAAPSASPAPSPTAAPSAYFPALGNNDPCTSLSAIVTRPTVTNTVCTVRPNHILVETGYQNTTADGGSNTVAYPQTLIRVGTVIPALELQVQPPSIARASAGGVVSRGTADVGAGLKYVFGYTPKFNYGGQVFVTAPTGTNGFSAGGTDVFYGLQAGYTLSSVFSLSAAVQDQSLTNGAQRWTSIVPSLALGVALPNSTNLFGEIAQFTKAVGPGTPTRTQYILGANHDFGSRLQVDAETGFSRTVSTGKYHYVGFGLSYYF